MNRILIVCTTDSMIYNFLTPHISKLQDSGYTVDCACSNNGYFQKIKTIVDVNLIEIPFKRNPFRLGNIKSLFKLNKVMKEGKYDLVHCHEPVGGVVGRLVGKINKVKTIYIAHGFHFFRGSSILSKVIYYPIEYIMSYFTDLLITINQEDYIASQRFRAKKTLKLNGIGIDLNKFSRSDVIYKREDFGFLDTDVLLLNVGELIKRKNQKTIIKSLKFTNYSSVKLIICGKGTLENKLKKLVLKEKVDNRVFFLGYRDDLNKIYPMCDIFVFSSLQEGLSVALMEAMASELPIVASNIRGNNDLVKDGYGGFLFKKRNEREVAVYVDNIIENKLSTSFGLFNRESLDKYLIQKIVDDLFEATLSIMEGK